MGGKPVNPIHISYTSVLHFLTVAKYMNMNQAAKELFISQPALSLSVSKLEKNLGITLFYRDKNKLVLSRDAESLMPFFEDFRESHDTLVQEMAAIKASQTRPVSVSFSGSPYYYSALCYSNTLTKYNNGNICLSYMNSSMALSMLLSGQVDFAISVVPLTHPLISYITLLTEPIGLVLPFCHPFSEKERIEVEDIPKSKIHGLQKGNSFRQLCDQICSFLRIALNYETEDDYPTYVKRMEAGSKDCAFFATKQNYEQNFKPLGAYIYKDINTKEFCRNTNIYFLPRDKKQYLYESLISLIRANMIQYSLLTTRFSQFINDEFL